MSYAQIFTACPGVWSDTDYRRFHKQHYKKADKDFGAWWAGQDDSITSLITPCKDPRWGIIRANVTLTDAKTDTSYQIKRKFVICLDSKSDYAGNIYNPDSKLGIYCKIFQSVLARPVHMVIKTLYHATLIGVARAIFNGIKKDKPIKEISKSVVRNLCDIVRTPIYETALLVLSVAGLLAAPFNPVLVYDFRATIGQLSNELNWGKRYDLFINLTPCMLRLANIMDFELNKQNLYVNYVYSDESNPTLVALENGIFKDKKAKKR